MCSIIFIEIPGDMFSAGGRSLLPYLLCGAGILLLLILLKRHAGLKALENGDEAPGKDIENVIPSLTPFEAALFLRDLRLVVLLMLVYLSLKGAVVIESPSPLRIKKKSEEGLSPLEMEFFRAFSEDGAISAGQLEHVFSLLASELGRKLWLCHKPMIRQFLNDKIELMNESIRAKGRVDSLEEMLWILFEDEEQISFLEGRPYFPGIADSGSLKSFMREVSLGIFEELMEGIWEYEPGERGEPKADEQ